MIKELVISILGEYEPVMTDVYTTSAPFEYVGSVVASGAAGVDWVYVGGLVLLALTLYSVFRIIGGVLSNA